MDNTLDNKKSVINSEGVTEEADNGLDVTEMIIDCKDCETFEDVEYAIRGFRVDDNFAIAMLLAFNFKELFKSVHIIHDAVTLEDIFSFDLVDDEDDIEVEETSATADDCFDNIEVSDADANINDDDEDSHFDKDKDEEYSNILTSLSECILDCNTAIELDSILTRVTEIIDISTRAGILDEDDAKFIGIILGIKLLKLNSKVEDIKCDILDKMYKYIYSHINRLSSILEDKVKDEYKTIDYYEKKVTNNNGEVIEVEHNEKLNEDGLIAKLKNLHANAPTFKGLFANVKSIFGVKS